MELLTAPGHSPRLVLPGSDPVAPRRGGRRVQRTLSAVLAVGLIAGLVLYGGGAGAQTVESLRARAAQLADELERLEQRSNALNEQHLEIQAELGELKAEQDENRREVEEAQARVDATRSEAADYLVQAYIGAGTHDGVALGSSDPNDAVNSKVMLEILRGDRQIVADKIQATRSDLEARAAELDASTEELEAAEARQAGIVEELESSVAEHDALLSSTNSQLDEAVAEERARREAEAAERARAAERAQQAAAERQTTTTSPSRSSSAGNSSGSSSSGGGATTTAPAPAAPTPAPALPPVSGPNGRAGTAIAAAKSHLGVPYRWGGTTPAGFDCSGLMLWSWAQAGVSLPRTSGAQRAYTQRISASQLQPGDLVFSGNPVYHVGMYVGGGQMIHSPHTGDVVKISPVRSGGSTSYGRIP